MTNNEEIKIEQKHVDMAVAAREKRRQDRASGKYSIATALISPRVLLPGQSLEELRQLGEPGEEACFAYIVDLEEGKQYVGRHLISNQDYDVLVCSWRSPIGSKYYVSNHHNPAGLSAKCLLIHQEPNILKDLEKTIFQDLTDKVQNLTREPESVVSDAVLDELNRDSTGSLKEIIKTIHASQFDIISTPRRGLHVVQGRPVQERRWLAYTALLGFYIQGMT
jgi:DNA helicase IV